jgi:hypothetical protein
LAPTLRIGCKETQEKQANHANSTDHKRIKIMKNDEKLAKKVKKSAKN